MNLIGSSETPIRPDASYQSARRERTPHETTANEIVPRSGGAKDSLSLLRSVTGGRDIRPSRSSSRFLPSASSSSHTHTYTYVRTFVAPRSSSFRFLLFLSFLLASWIFLSFSRSYLPLGRIIPTYHGRCRQFSRLSSSSVIWLRFRVIIIVLLVCGGATCNVL